MGRLIVFIFLLGTLCIQRSSVFGQTNRENDSAVALSGLEVWAKALEAHGGKQRMSTIENMVVVEKSNIGGVVRSFETFAVFPDKLWTRIDNGPGKIGVVMEMENFGTKKRYQGNNGQKSMPLQNIEQSRILEISNPDGGLKWNALAAYVLETKWWKPIPEHVDVSLIEDKPVYVVRTKLNGLRADYYFTKVDYQLIRRVLFFEDAFMKAEYFTDYRSFTNVNGLMIPRKITSYGPGKPQFEKQITVLLNVDYNQKIFEEAPGTPIDSANAWKVIKR